MSKNIKYDGILVVEIALDSSQSTQDFPATTPFDGKEVVAIEAYRDALKTPKGKNMIGTTNSGAAIADSYVLIKDINGNVRVDNYPLSRMMLLSTGLGPGPLEFQKPFKISWADCKLIVNSPASNITTGEAAVFYVYFNYNK